MTNKISTRRDFLRTCAVGIPAGLLARSLHADVPDREVWKLPDAKSFRVIDNEWIPMPDGTQLAVRLWLPEVFDRVPVVMEYLPYRKDDATRGRDAPTGRYLAQHGIAFARVDMRGSGDARGGLLGGEYLPHEQSDGVAAIAWLARQPWSNGSVGMRGKSWGGFNALQIAALAPQELKAIMPMCFSDNRYTDDAHYVGGALGLVNFEWGTLLQEVLVAPPDPKIFGPQWKAEWLKRLGAMPAVLAEWLDHQRFDAYWQSQSVGLEYGRIKCPVYCVGGWEDGYNNSLTRALSNLKVPRKGLIGAWAHYFPPDGMPGPALEWVYEEVRWWQQWLGGIETGIMSEPMFRFYMPERKAVEIFPQDTPGRWVAEDVWPSPRIRSKVFFLNRGVLSGASAPTERIVYDAGGIVGLQRMEWLPFAIPIDLAKEQSSDDAQSVLFDSSVLEDDLEIMGHATVKLRISASVPVAQVALRLCELTPAGRSWQVTYGLLNLTHRDSHEHPTPLVPGQFYEIELALNLMAHRFKKGNRIRLALSDGLWPLVWPAPRKATLTLMTGVSTLTLPVRPPRSREPAFNIPVIHNANLSAAPAEVTVSVSGPGATGLVSIDKHWPEKPQLIEETQTTMSSGWRKWHMEARSDDPNSGRWSGDFLQRFERADWGKIALLARFELTSSIDAFRIKESIQARDGDSVIFERRWAHSIKRDLM